MPNIKTTAEKALSAAELDAAMGWDWFSAFIRAHPKTGFFCGVILGAAVGTFITWILP